MGHVNTDETHRSLWPSVNAEILYVPSKNKYMRVALLSDSERLEALEMQMKNMRAQMGVDAKAAAKVEKKAGVLLLGFMDRAQKQRDSIVKAHEALCNSAIELATFEKLRLLETQAIVSRTAVSNKGMGERGRGMTRTFFSTPNTYCSTHIIICK